MIAYIKGLYFIFISVLKSKYRWLAIFYMIWLYRIEFIPDTGGGIAKVLQVISLFVIIMLLAKYGGNFVAKGFSRTNGPVRSVLILYSFAVLSTAWAFLPQFAFFISFQNVVMILAMVWMLTLFKDFCSVEKAFIYFVVFSLLFESFALRISMQHVLVAHFLPTGSCAAILFSYCVGEYLAMHKTDAKRKKLLKHTILLSVFMLFINTSGGANASAAFGLAVALWLSGKIFIAFVLTAGAVYISVSPDLMNEVLLALMPDKDIELIESGNGRQVIWEILLETAGLKPLLGWGFACVERTVGTIFGGQILSDTHNNYIGMYGSLGIVGLVLFIIHYLSQLVFVLKRRLKPGYVGILSATACGMLNGYSYGYMSGKTCSITVVYFALVALGYSYYKIKSYNGTVIKR